MVAHLAQLNQDVLVVRHRVRLLYHAFLQQVAVNLLLLLRDTHLHMDLNLGWQALFHLLLDPTQKEWLQDSMQLLNDLLVSLLLLGFGHFFLALAQIKPLVEIVRAGENFRKQEVKEGPELVQIVLKRGTSQ